jgi:hypothetical protein
MRRLTTTAVLLVAVTAALSAASPAFAEAPWWHLVSGSRPSYIKPGSAQSEAQELTVRGTSEVLVELTVGSHEVGVFGTEPFVAEFGVEELSAANVQKALEKVYGSGNVTVTDESTPAEIKLRVTSGGDDADRDLESGELIKMESYTEVPSEATVVTAGHPDGEIYVTAANLGDATVAGEKSPVRLADVLPHGLRAVAIAGSQPDEAGKASFLGHDPLPCSLASVSCRLSDTLPSFEQIEMRIGVMAESGATSGELNTASVSGGEGFSCQPTHVGAGQYRDSGCIDESESGNYTRISTGLVSSASIKRPMVLSSVPVSFGTEDYELVNEEYGGTPATQAGAHPFQQTTTIVLNHGADTAPLENVGHKPNVLPSSLVKDLHFKWPAGLIGNPNPIPQCKESQFFKSTESGGATECEADTAVGVANITINEPSLAGMSQFTVPLFNLPPRVGEPARFGFDVPIAGVPVLIDTSVRSGGDYGVTVSVNNITQSAAFISSEVTVWGVPGDPRHNHQRGWACLLESTGDTLEPTSDGGLSPCSASEVHGEQHLPPFLSLPTSCTGSEHSTVEGDSWANAGAYATLADYTMPALDSCNRLPFSPTIKVTPDGTAGSTPTGLNVDVHVPQEESLNPSGLAVADPRNITVALPNGVSVNPASGDGLVACSEALAGFTGFAELLPGTQTPTFTSAGPASLVQGVNFCPNASKIGTVRIKTPILPNSIEGAVYLASENQNPFGSLVAMYVFAEDPVSGVVIKLAGNIHLSETGQLVTTFENSPQAPFEDAEFHFFGGERAPLATPARCGAYSTTTSIEPWSGNAPSTPSSTFDVTSGPGGSPCPGAMLPFAPTLTGGTSNINAGSFSPFVMTFGREDGEQNLQSIQLHMPPGLEGLLSSVKLCSEAQANEGTCGPESQIGETTVSAGVGHDPVSVVGGRVYITEGYDGAPYGLSIVNPVKAGPFDLEHDTSNPNDDPPCDCIVVRAKIEVNPATADLTITTDQSGPHAIPHLIDGIPVQIKRVNVTINREHFTFNPTNCSPLALTGAIGSDEGGSQSLAVPFQATNCAILKFTPTLSVTTAAKASKAKGESLQFKIAYPKGAMGSQSWFNEAKFDIPKQLPARLSTIQQACDAATFETNRAACPKHSVIGSAVVRTPVLPVPLEGPVYFVSYGGAKFPDAVLVLKGYGLTIELHGNTFINGSSGVTSATFKALPDVPFESIEVTLPAGEYSEFGANLPAKAHFDFCGQKLTMPTFFKASNGAQINQDTPVTIAGCPKAKKVKKASKHKSSKANRHK